MFQEVSEEQVYQELLKERSDEELHEMSEQELYDLIATILMKIRLRKVKKLQEYAKTIYT